MRWNEEHELLPIIFSDDLPECPDCEEPWCPKHEQHYYDCACLGLDEAIELGYEIVEIDGRLFASKR